MTCPGVRAGAPLALAASIAAALAGSGCSTVQRARAFQDPASAIPGERTPTAAELGLSSSGPIELELLIAKALEVNPTVLQARRNVEITRAHVLEAEAGLKPQVGASASGGYRDSKGAPDTVENHRFFSYGFDVSWLLFDFGRTKAQTKNLAELWLAAQHDLMTSELDVAFNVRSAYINLSRQVALAEVADETVRQFEARLEQVKAFVEVGTRIPYDETKAEVDLGTARLAQVRTHDAVLLAEATLSNAIGLAEVVDWQPEFDARLPAIPEDFDAAWAIAREHQPTLAAAAARVAAASFGVDARVAALYPSLDIGFSYTWAGPTFPLPWSWVVSPALSYLAYDGGARIAAIDESVAALRSARSAQSLVEQGAWLDTRSAWLAIQDARQRVEVTTLTVENAGQQFELAKALFSVGKNTSVDLADAQQVLAQSRADLVQAKADLQAATAALARAIGIVVEEDGEGAAP
jgi:outer membrane protein